jgi:protein-L-isoaspartate(D-aspartate) O-methyltransferase
MRGVEGVVLGFLLVGAGVAAYLWARADGRGERTPEKAMSPISVALDGSAGGALGAGAAIDAKASSARLAMVRDQIEARGVRDARVLDAMREVPRHRFVPDDIAPRAYQDRPHPIGYDQTISQPYIVAFMTDALRLKGHEKVLEIGTGSGYQAAVLAKLVPHVYTIEIVEPLAKRAAQTLRTLGFSNVVVRAGDGYRGWPEHAPFDAIMLTAAPEKIPQPLVDQLKPGGTLVAPVGERWDQELVRIRKLPDGGVERERLLPVRFVPMTGEAEKKSK